MHSADDSMHEWKEFVTAQSTKGAPRRQASASSAPHGGLLSQQACIDWREQPPRKRARQQQQQQQQQQQAATTATTHKEVEKQRRDRMNQAIGSLSRLIPAAYLKQGQNRVEKAEVIELAAQHMLALTSQLERCKAALGRDFPAAGADCCIGQFYQGFCDSSKAALHFLTDQGGFSTTDSLCCRLRSHLHNLAQKHLPDKSELPSLSVTQPASNRKNHHQHDSDSCSCSSTDDETPTSCSSDVVDLRGRAGDKSDRCSPSKEDEATRLDPKSAFKKRFEAQSAAAAASEQRSTPGARDEQQTEEDEEPQLLPGFVLHESGTHYLPLVVPQSALGTELLTGRQRKLLSSSRDGSPLLHPVSIPVNFGATRFVRARDFGGTGKNS